MSGTARTPALVVVPLSCAGNWAREADNDLIWKGNGWGMMVRMDEDGGKGKWVGEVAV